MDGVSIGKLARETGIPVNSLIEHLSEIGFTASDRNSLVSGADQLRLLQLLRRREHKSDARPSISIEDIRSADSLDELNHQLTQAMANQEIQSLARDTHLDTIVKRILTLTDSSRSDQGLLAAVILQRLAAVIRGSRGAGVLAHLAEVVLHEPPPLEALPDADSKTYAAMALAQVDAPWVLSYAAKQAVLIDAADIARKELLTLCLQRERSVADWVTSITHHAGAIRALSSTARQRRVRRVFASMRDVAQQSREPIGPEIGDRLSECLRAFLSPIPAADYDEDAIAEALDHALSLLRRIVELRFSIAMQPESYRVLLQAKKTVGVGRWPAFVRRSTVVPELRVQLLEAALVLARQNRTDRKLAEALELLYASRAQTSAALRRHLKDAIDLDPQVADWWRKLGRVAPQGRSVEQKVGNTEDFEIGSLLIDLDKNREAMDKVGRAVVPLLDITDPVLASTVRNAVTGYKDIEQTARRLARMRKLERTDVVGNVVDYNPLEHDLIGGHTAGVRRVTVVREGVRKDFGGRIRTLVKPWVEKSE